MQIEPKKFAVTDQQSLLVYSLNLMTMLQRIKDEGLDPMSERGRRMLTELGQQAYNDHFVEASFEGEPLQQLEDTLARKAREKAERCG